MVGKAAEQRQKGVGVTDKFRRRTAVGQRRNGLDLQRFLLAALQTNPPSALNCVERLSSRRDEGEKKEKKDRATQLHLLIGPAVAACP